MKGVIVAMGIVGAVVLARPSPAAAGEPGVLLTPGEMRAYHACLYEAWIQDWCHASNQPFAQCVIANGGGRYPLEGRRYTEDYCWSTAQGLPPGRPPGHLFSR